MSRLVYLTFLWCLLTTGLRAQELKPAGGFLADSLKIGEPVPYYLALSYPSTLDVVFPDSLYDFAPFELDHKDYFPTRTNDGTSYDSAVYYLSTFEIDSVQYLSLPVFQVSVGDSIPLNARMDTVYLKQVVTEIPDSVAVEAMPLKENTDYIHIPLQFNYPYFIIGAVILFLALIVVIVAFGGRIMRRWKLYRLERKHRKFREEFETLLHKQDTPVRQHSEQLILFWKRYLESLENLPYTKSTSRELTSFFHHGEELKVPLDHIDRAIYGNKDNTLATESFENLKTFADDRFKMRLAQLRNG